MVHTRARLIMRMKTYFSLGLTKGRLRQETQGGDPTLTQAAATRLCSSTKGHSSGGWLTLSNSCPERPGRSDRSSLWHLTIRAWFSQSSPHPAVVLPSSSSPPTYSQDPDRLATDAPALTRAPPGIRLYLSLPQEKTSDQSQAKKGLGRLISPPQRKLQ